jgi:hypothetical protein
MDNEIKFEKEHLIRIIAMAYSDGAISAANSAGYYDEQMINYYKLEARQYAERTYEQINEAG